MRKLIAAMFVLAFACGGALAQSQQAPTLRIVSEDGNRLPSELMYGNTKVKPLRLRPGTNQPITIDDSDFFVQEQYVDFLSRFPDASGFQFWQNEINQCGANAGCVEVAVMSGIEAANVAEGRPLTHGLAGRWYGLDEAPGKMTARATG